MLYVQPGVDIRLVTRPQFTLRDRHGHGQGAPHAGLQFPGCRLNEPRAGSGAKSRATGAVGPGEVDCQAELAGHLQVSRIEIRCRQHQVVQAVGVAMQGLLVEGVDVIRQAGKVQVQHGRGAVILLSRVGFAAGAQQIHGQRPDVPGQQCQLVARRRGLVPLVIQGDGPGQAQHAAGQALTEVAGNHVDRQAQQYCQAQQAQHELQPGGAGAVGADGDDDLAGDIRLHLHRCLVLVEALSQGLARLSQGLALHIEDGHLLGGRRLDEALQRGRYTEQVAGFQ